MGLTSLEYLQLLGLNVLVNVLFGGYSVFTSVALRSSTLSPLVFSFCRDTIAAVLLITAAWVSEGRKPVAERRFWIAREHAMDIALLGLLGVWGTQGMSALALANVPAAYFGLCSPVQPMVAMCLSLLWGAERWHPGRWTSWLKVGGLVLSVSGAIALAALAEASKGSSTGIIGQSKNFALGSFFIFLQVTTGGSYQVMQKFSLSRYPSIVVAAWGYCAGAGMLLLSVLPCAMDAASWNLSDPLVLGAVAYAATVCSAFNYGAMAYINARAGPVFLTAAQPLQGLTAALLAALVLGQHVGMPEAVGGTIISTGLLASVFAKVREGAIEAAEERQAGKEKRLLLRGIGDDEEAA
jgi:drug/metabolite transporter (DMT)-like permease